jgi:hypothetical protein
MMPISMLITLFSVSVKTVRRRRIGGKMSSGDRHAHGRSVELGGVLGGGEFHDQGDNVKK